MRLGRTRRGVVVSLGGLLGLSGCLRSTEATTPTAISSARSTASGRPTTNGEPFPAEPSLDITSSDGMERPLPLGEPVDLSVRVRNRGESDRSIEVVLLGDGEPLGSREVTVPAGGSRTTTFTVQFDERRTVELVSRVRSDGTVLDEYFVGETRVKPVWRVTLDWSDVARPSEINPDSRDDRLLAFYCARMRMYDDSGAPLAEFDVGGTTEPALESGYHGVETGSRNGRSVTVRWFGTEAARTVFVVDEFRRERAAEMTMWGRPLPENLAVTVLVDGERTDEKPIDRGWDVYRLSLEP